MSGGRAKSESGLWLNANSVGGQKERNETSMDFFFYNLKTI